MSRKVKLKKDYVFRSHALHNLMVGAKPYTAEARLTELQLKKYKQLVAKYDREGLTEAEQNALEKLDEKIMKPIEPSETFKRYCEKVWLEQEKGYTEFFENKYTRKGIAQQRVGIELLNEVTGSKYSEHVGRRVKKFSEGGILAGTPDIFCTNEMVIVDIKCSYDPTTFIKANLKPEYEWQLRAYMMLFDIEKAKLVYTLVDIDDDNYRDELQRFIWQNNIIDPDVEEAQQLISQFRANLYYSDNPMYSKAERVKQYVIERDTTLENLIYVQVREANEYCNNLTLNKTYEK